MNLKTVLVKILLAMSVFLAFNSNAKKIYKNNEIGFAPFYQVWLGEFGSKYNPTFGYALQYTNRKRTKSEAMNRYVSSGILLGYSSFQPSAPSFVIGKETIFDNNNNTYQDKDIILTLSNLQIITLLYNFRNEIPLIGEKLYFYWGIGMGVDYMIHSHSISTDGSSSYSLPAGNISAKVGIINEITKNFGFSLEQKYAVVVGKLTEYYPETGKFDHFTSTNLSAFIRF